MASSQDCQKSLHGGGDSIGLDLEGCRDSVGAGSVVAFEAKRSGSQSMACHSFISSVLSFSDSVKYRSDQPGLGCGGGYGAVGGRSG